MPNQTVKNSLKTKRIKLPQMKFFLEKQSFCKILIELIQSYENAQYAGTNGQFDLNKFFFGTNHYYYFPLPVGPFHCAKFTKNSYSRSKYVRMLHFWTQNCPFAPNNFFWKIINIIFI